VSTVIGRAAEDAAILYLQGLGYKVVAKNWRTRWCEIDIVAIKDQVTYFVEAKYRSSNTWGSGLEYITPRKLQQMHFSAEFWAATHKTRDYRLSAIELTGEPPRVTDFIESIE
jgi:uncharacterized protein (TIGR00252 family)